MVSCGLSVGVGVGVGGLMGGLGLGLGLGQDRRGEERTGLTAGRYWQHHREERGHVVGVANARALPRDVHVVAAARGALGPDLTVRVG